MTATDPQRAIPRYLKEASENFQRGDLDACFAILHAAHRNDPSDAKIVVNLGVFSASAGRGEDAVRYLREATAVDPASYEAWYNLGLLLRDAGRGEEARAALQRALDLRPESASAATALAFVSIALGDHVAALTLLRRAAQIEPDMPAHWSNLGNLLQDRSQYEEARAALAQAIALDPRHLQARYNLATLDYRVGDIEAASAAFDEIAQEELSEDYFSALQRRYFPHISSARYDGFDLLEMGRAISRKLPRPEKPFLSARARGPKLKIGFLSADFRQHSCAYFLRPLFENFDRERYELHCFAELAPGKFDSESQFFKDTATTWFETYRVEARHVARAVADAGIDVLFELGGYSGSSLVSVCAYRPAVAIVAWLGFPGSTGIPEIGYRIGDGIADPPGAADGHFSEQLVRLEGPFLCYSSPPDAPAVAPPPHAIVGAPTFGTFNNPHKIRPPVAAAWTRIVLAVPGAKLLLKAPLATEPKAGGRLRRMFLEAGLPADRLIVAGGHASTADHLAAYARLDVALDTFPYNGTTTTCEALWMGVPVVSFAGDRHSARVGASLLRHVGLGELVADDIDGYVATAVALARDPARLAAYRSSLRSRLAHSPVMDGRAWTRNFEAAIEKIYKSAVAL